MKKFFGYILAILFILKIQVLSVGCANMLPPFGGAKDTLPPVLLKASPPDSSRNFTASRITLTFDEFVQLDNPHQNLIISPVPEKEPNVESHLRTVTIKLKDTLQPNTTYTLHFGKTIKDVNEGNFDKNLAYIFSTGPLFDSLTLSGKVKMAETGNVDSTLTVMLHQHGDDSAVVNEKPRYITHLDSAGNFTFRNLPYGTFYIYALDDQGGGHRYSSPDNQLFAFADTPVVMHLVNQPLTLYAYTEKSPSPTRTGTTPQFGNKQRAGNTEKRLKLQTNLASNQLDLLGNLIITSDLPLRNLDTSLLHFSSDSTFTPVVGYQIALDTSKKKLTLQNTWKENTSYHLIIDKDFAEDTLGRKLLKTDTLSFKTKKLSDYGSLTIRFKNLDTSIHPVLLFIQDNNIVKSIPLTSATITQTIFSPGDYELRILQDRNGNGKWDAGEFFGKHIQPEIVKPIVSRLKISVKPDWQNEFDIAL